ncbi:hypothetical protein FGO68_gene6940 [Halteria grandinella]|uniref:Uncharacterized protein n=1 Tax=Halteria grandinella TaxID=5974 RepID=A0A8J8P4K9_HALGN|nr:hypothetical protein FGO68_gene6940 [Halteria grandinella]
MSQNLANSSKLGEISGQNTDFSLNSTVQGFFQLSTRLFFQNEMQKLFSEREKTLPSASSGSTGYRSLLRSPFEGSLQNFISHVLPDLYAILKANKVPKPEEMILGELDGYIGSSQKFKGKKGISLSASAHLKALKKVSEFLGK